MAQFRRPPGSKQVGQTLVSKSAAVKEGGLGATSEVRKAEERSSGRRASSIPARRTFLAALCIALLIRWWEKWLVHYPSKLGSSCARKFVLPVYASKDTHYVKQKVTS